MRRRVRDYQDYVQDMVDSIIEIESFIAGMNFEAFSRDKKTINAVVRSVEVIGEATKKIPKNIRDNYPDIPWKKMSGMRDKLIHEYFGIDYEILWKAANDEIPPIKTTIKNILNNLNE